MSAERPKAILLVEGDGDIQAVPDLIHKALNNLGIHNVDTDRSPIKVCGIPRLRGDGELERFIKYGDKKNGDVILLIIDCDDDCPLEVAAEFLGRIRQIQPVIAKKVGIVFFKKEFESLFLFSISKLLNSTTEYGWDLGNFDVDLNMEDIRDAKGQLRKLMKKGKSYKETTDQKALLNHLDFDRLRAKSRSFQHFENTLRWVAGQHESNSTFYPVL